MCQDAARGQPRHTHLRRSGGAPAARSPPAPQSRSPTAPHQQSPPAPAPTPGGTLGCHPSGRAATVAVPARGAHRPIAGGLQNQHRVGSGARHAAEAASRGRWPHIRARVVAQPWHARLGIGARRRVSSMRRVPACLDWRECASVREEEASCLQGRGVTLSPRMAPPLNWDEGSTASTATLSRSTSFIPMALGAAA